MRLSLVTASTVEPLLLPETKLGLRMAIDADDAEIQALISAARLRIERVTGRQLYQATWDLAMSEFPWAWDYEIQLPKPPLLTVVSISYVDTAGVTQVWASSNYQVDAPAGPTAPRGRVRPAYATNWPPARVDTLNAVTIRFTAGYGTKVTEAPEDLRRAALLLVRGWYADDDKSLERALALMVPYKTFA